MSDVDWLALWVEFAQAIDNEQLEVAERIIYLDGRWNFTELSSSKLIAAARQIIRERVEGRSKRNSGSTYAWPVTACRRRARICVARVRVAPRTRVMAKTNCPGFAAGAFSLDRRGRRARIVARRGVVPFPAVVSKLGPWVRPRGLFRLRHDRDHHPHPRAALAHRHRRLPAQSNIQMTDGFGRPSS